MKNKYTWLILGFVIGIVVSIAVCWFYCCDDFCNGCCKMAGKEKCQTVQVIDQPDFAPITISVDTAAAYFHCYMENPDTIGVFVAYNINLSQLNAMNLLRNSDSTLTGFRIYPGVFGDPTNVTIVVGVDGAGDDNTSTIYTTGAAGTGPCPTVCDAESPITNPGG